MRIPETALKVNPLPNLNDIQSQDYSLFLTSLGYESRSRYFAESYSIKASNNVAWIFENSSYCAFDRNREFYCESGFNLIHPGDFNLISLLAPFRSDGVLRICADISSMTRERIALLISTCRKIGRTQRLILDCVYCLGEYSPPSDGAYPIQVRASVNAELAGWQAELEKPVALIVGMGYEQDLAVGIYEFFEPSQFWLFRPVGHDKRYSAAIDLANEDLLANVSGEQILTYPFNDIYQCFLQLQSLVHGLVKTFRVTCVPFGLKGFALATILLGYIYFKDVSVWRVSPGQIPNPSDRVANGIVSGLSVEFSPSSNNESNHSLTD